MTDTEDTCLEEFVNALKRLHLAQKQVSNFKQRSKSEINSDKLSDAEYSFSWIERLETEIPVIRNELSDTFGALNYDIQTEVYNLVKRHVR